MYIHYYESYVFTNMHTSIFNYLYTDVDECADGTNGCNHNCSNTNGSYVCFCFTGYELHDNMQTCTGNVCYQLIADKKKHRCEYNAKHTWHSF